MTEQLVLPDPDDPFWDWLGRVDEQAREDMARVNAEHERAQHDHPDP
jgi:hypothetical protein